MSSGSAGSVLLPSDKTRRGAFSEVINFKVTITQHDLEDKAVRQALEKWYLIFSSPEDAWPKGFNLRDAIKSHDLESMKIEFGNRSSSTILRRGTSSLQFFRWYKI